MKTSFWLLLFAIGIATVCCSGKREIRDATLTTDTGVVINGVRWATRNVDAPGTFAFSPYEPGMLYQWNRRMGWLAIPTGGGFQGVVGWDSSTPVGVCWCLLGKSQRPVSARLACTYF